MADLPLNTPLKAGATYSWWMRLLMAPPDVVRKGGPIDGQDHWGKWVAPNGATGKDAMDAVQTMLAKKLRVSPAQTTVYSFNLQL